MKELLRSCLVVALLAQGIAVCGQADPQLVPQTHTIPVAVVDVEGKPVSGLSAEHFVVRGVSARLRLVADNRPREIVLLLDVSPSMAWQGREHGGKWQTAKEAIRQFIEAADASQPMSLHAYAERHERVVSTTTSKHALLARLQELPEPGSPESEMRFGKYTAFVDALTASLETGLGFGDVVLVVADSMHEDTRSKTKLETAVRLAVERGVRVYFADVDQPFSGPPESPGPRVSGALPPSPSPEQPPAIEPFESWIHRPGSRPDSRLVRRIVEETGGEVLFIWKGATYYHPGSRFELPPDGLRNVARHSLASMAPAYRLELELDTVLRKKRKIDVRLVRDGKKRTDVRVYHPKHLFPAHRWRVLP